LLDQGVPGEVIRFVFLMTHYRSPMDWTAEKARQAKEALLSFIELTHGVESVDPDQLVIDALADDLNTSAAIARLHALRKAGEGAKLLASARLMGLLSYQPTVSAFGWGQRNEDHYRLANEVARKWANLRGAGDYTGADRLKALAAEAGVELQATKQAVGQGAQARLRENFDPAKLEALQ
jgi:cysteinyl-tRNA synthetase